MNPAVAVGVILLGSVIMIVALYWVTGDVHMSTITYPRSARCLLCENECPILADDNYWCEKCEVHFPFRASRDAVEDVSRKCRAAQRPFYQKD